MAKNGVTRDMLTEARNQYHALVTGTMPRVVVDQNGERVEFTAANKQGLYSYIRELEVALGTSCGGTAPDLAETYAPMTFQF